MTTMTMYQKQTIDLDALVAVAEIARQATPEGHSWRQPLEDAYNYLIQRDAVYFSLVTPDSFSFQSSRHPTILYAATGQFCQCPAFQHHRPCWHRAAVRLLQRMIAYRQAQIQSKPVYTVPDSYEQAVREMDELFA